MNSTFSNQSSFNLIFKSNLTISNSKFDHNSNGALYVKDSSIDISDSEFKHNERDKGGALLLDSN